MRVSAGSAAALSCALLLGGCGGGSSPTTSVSNPVHSRPYSAEERGPVADALGPTGAYWPCRVVRVAETGHELKPLQPLGPVANQQVVTAPDEAGGVLLQSQDRDALEACVRKAANALQSEQPIPVVSKRRFVAKADAICRREQAINYRPPPGTSGLEKHLSSISPAKLRQLGDAFRRIVRLESSFLDRLRAFQPPRGEAPLSRYIELQVEMAGRLQRFAQALHRGDRALATRLNQSPRLNDLANTAAEIGARYGFKWCINET